jgi:predicted transcriptional regulator
MKFHINQFKILDNLHDLFCRGTMNYKKALAIVQDYNMSKILAKRVSIPSSSGTLKDYTFELMIFHHVYTDVELYNFVDYLLRLRKMGILQQQIASGSIETQATRNKFD